MDQLKDLQKKQQMEFVKLKKEQNVKMLLTPNKRRKVEVTM